MICNEELFSDVELKNERERIYVYLNNHLPAFCHFSFAA